MNFFNRLLNTSLLLLLTVVAFAQLSDQQVVEELKKYKSAGMTQEQVLADLASKGVTKEQLERIKAQYDASTAAATGTVVTPQNRTREQSTEGSDKVVVVKETTKNNPNDIFGKDLFSSKNLTFQPNINLPTPENYQLGAGDEIIADIWGNSELTFRQFISPEGNIIVPNIGPIFLNGMQIKEASVKIRRAFSRIYSDLSSPNPGTFIKVTLGNIRSIQVNIMGEVVLPGTYTLSSFASVFHALYSAGGINNIGSLRDIKVYRNGKVVSNIDIYEYLLKGNNSGDITLKEGDIVKVEPFKKRVQITGMVKRSMVYEMKENETLSTLIEYAGGFESSAYKKNLILTRKGDSELKIYTVESGDFGNFQLNDGDTVTVGNILDKYENRVEIEGAIFRPGIYAIDSGLKTIKDLVNMAEGPKGDAFLARVLLYRENRDLSTTMESINLYKLLSGEIPDVALKKNDRLYIPSADELRNELFITLTGEVKRPANYPYVRNMSIEDLILQGGGLLESASRARIDVSRRINKPMSKTESTIQSEVFSFSLDKGFIISGDKDFVLRPFDIVNIRRSPGYETQQNVYLRGEIIFGGAYPKITKDEKLSSFIKRAGGLTSSAYAEGARLTRVMNADERTMAEASLKLSRQSEKDSISVENLAINPTYNVGIDLAKAISNPGSDNDIVLREGDIINIPTMNSVVKISGAVMYPNAVTYVKGMKIEDYINNAGGYAFRARKSRAYVVYMNNTVSKGLHSPIEPGCEIIVPMKPERKGMNTGEIVGISSSLATVVALVVNLFLK
ncbi:MAG: SLBB domain-containing protein [Bacteroidales bacterium]